MTISLGEVRDTIHNAGDKSVRVNRLDFQGIKSAIETKQGVVSEGLSLKVLNDAIPTMKFVKQSYQIIGSPPVTTEQTKLIPLNGNFYFISTTGVEVYNSSMVKIATWTSGRTGYSMTYRYAVAIRLLSDGNYAVVYKSRTTNEGMLVDYYNSSGTWLSTTTYFTSAYNLEDYDFEGDLMIAIDKRNSSGTDYIKYVACANLRSKQSFTFGQNTTVTTGYWLGYIRACLLNGEVYVVYQNSTDSTVKQIGRYSLNFGTSLANPLITSSTSFTDRLDGSYYALIRAANNTVLFVNSGSGASDNYLQAYNITDLSKGVYLKMQTDKKILNNSKPLVDKSLKYLYYINNTSKAIEKMYSDTLASISASSPVTMTDINKEFLIDPMVDEGNVCIGINGASSGQVFNPALTQYALRQV